MSQDPKNETSIPFLKTTQVTDSALQTLFSICLSTQIVMILIESLQMVNSGILKYFKDNYNKLDFFSFAVYLVLHQVAKIGHAEGTARKLEVDEN